MKVVLEEQKMLRKALPTLLLQVTPPDSELLDTTVQRFYRAPL